MRTPNKGIELGAWMLENGHRALLTVTGGRFPRSVLGMTSVELRTLGRKSGRWRPTLLAAPICETDRVVLVASKGGHQDHPQWYKNLAVNPGVEITVDGRTRLLRGRTASPAERSGRGERVVAV